MTVEKVPIVRSRSSQASVAHSSSSPSNAIYTTSWAQMNAATAQNIALNALMKKEQTAAAQAPSRSVSINSSREASARAAGPIRSTGAYRLLATERNVAVIRQEIIPGKNVIRRGFSDDVTGMHSRTSSARAMVQNAHRVLSAREPSHTTEYGHVYLNIYDLEAVNKVINVVAGTFGAGAYHAGVEIYGAEYNFGYTSNGGSGIVHSYPRCHPSHVYRKTIDLGKTPLTPRQVLELVESLKPQWPGASYDILSRNCLNFANEFCVSLEVGPIPPWVMGLQNKINWTRESFNNGAAKLKKFDETVGISRAFGTLSRKLTGECIRPVALTNDS